VDFEICERTDKQTDRHADHNTSHTCRGDVTSEKTRVCCIHLLRTVCVQLQCLSCKQRCPRVAAEQWSVMPWIVQLITGKSSCHRDQQNDTDTGKCKYESISFIQHRNLKFLPAINHLLFLYV